MARSEIISFYGCLNKLKNITSSISRISRRIRTDATIYGSVVRRIKKVWLSGREYNTRSAAEWRNKYIAVHKWNNNLYSTMAIPKETILEKVDHNNEIWNLSSDQLGYYLAGALRDRRRWSHLTSFIRVAQAPTLNRVLNPRIVFTSHSNNLKLYANILAPR